MVSGQTRLALPVPFLSLSLGIAVFVRILPGICACNGQNGLRRQHPPARQLEPTPNLGTMNMKTRTVFRTLVLCLAVAAVSAVGVALRHLAPREAATSPRHDIPHLEYFASAQSFSEVEQTRAQLRALSRRYLYSLQVRQVDALRGVSAGGAIPAASGGAGDSPLVREVEEAIREFRGTGEELVLAQGLLILLASEGAYVRWLELYLDLLYRRPTEDVVGRLADTAVMAGRATGRLGEVFEAFRHVCRIPLAFGSKARLQALLGDQELAVPPATPRGFQAFSEPGHPPLGPSDRSGA